MNLKLLEEPFRADEVEWRIAQSGISKAGKPWAKVLAYITSRALFDRLDMVCGRANWKNEIQTIGNGSIVVGISIKMPDGEWVTKWDGSGPMKVSFSKDEVDYENSVKGTISAAWKRAGVPWGIGRYLYALPEAWADFKEDGMYKAKVNGQWHSWSPPALPDWALPNPMTDKQKERMKELYAAAGWTPQDLNNLCVTMYGYNTTNLTMLTGADFIQNLEQYVAETKGAA